MAVRIRVPQASPARASSARSTRLSLASPIERSLVAGAAMLAAFVLSQQAVPVVREGIAIVSFLLHLLGGGVMFCACPMCSGGIAP